MKDSLALNGGNTALLCNRGKIEVQQAFSGVRPMTYQTLTFSLAEGVATITMNRPDDANALNLQMANELLDLSMMCSADERVRAVIVTGQGKMFCAGGDLREMDEQGDRRPEHLTRMAGALHAALIRFANMDAPVIMAINGTAAGGGFSMALSGDIILASDKAKFVAAYTASGSSTYFLAKHVGMLRAKELLFTNRLLSAQEACDWGMVTRVVPADSLMDEALKMAAAFASGPTRAFGGLKQLLQTTYSDSMETQLERETRHISSMMRTYDGPHGLNAFLNKQKPQFKGR
jgi:2-(1,2-epoxy-1,2-dihydrophenyl)acetyl-CoA isomerase